MNERAGVNDHDAGTLLNGCVSATGDRFNDSCDRLVETSDELRILADR